MPASERELWITRLCLRLYTAANWSFHWCRLPTFFLLPLPLVPRLLVPVPQLPDGRCNRCSFSAISFSLAPLANGFSDSDIVFQRPGHSAGIIIYLFEIQRLWRLFRRRIVMALQTDQLHGHSPIFCCIISFNWFISWMNRFSISRTLNKHSPFAKLRQQRKYSTHALLVLTWMGRFAVTGKVWFENSNDKLGDMKIFHSSKNNLSTDRFRWSTSEFICAVWSRPVLVPFWNAAPHEEAYENNDLHLNEWMEMTSRSSGTNEDLSGSSGPPVMRRNRLLLAHRHFSFVCRTQSLIVIIQMLRNGLFFWLPFSRDFPSVHLIFIYFFS